MGCDIHFYVVVKPEAYDGQAKEQFFWQEADLSIDRNYDLFAYMAGVRNRDNVTPIAPKRGVMPGLAYLPDWFGNIDGHSHSWLTPEEFLEAVVASGTANASVRAAMAYINEWVASGRDTRIVFCFDN